MTNSPKTRTASSSALLGSDASRSTVNPENEAYRLALIIAEAADDRKGADIVLLNVSEVSYIADYFVIATGFSNVQVRAIARSIEDEVNEKLQRLPAHAAGQTDGSWVLLDYGDVIAHIFLPQEREFYNLEAFWGHGERTPFAALQLSRD